MFPSDVPVHRASVGAMKVTQAVGVEEYVFKPYVYRGKGYDIYEPEPEPEPKKRKPWTQARRKREQQRRIERRRAEEARYREEWRKRQIENQIYWEKERAKHERHKRWAAEADENLRRKHTRPIRPAQGWSPTTGEDIEKILDEIGES